MQTLPYWRSACRETSRLRKLVFAAMATALTVAVAGLFIPVGANLRVTFKFLPMALCGAVCGPVLTCAAGIASDLVGFLMFPTGAFFPGYTLTAAVSGLLYGLFLYRRPPTLLRLALCKLTVNVVCFIGLNTVWSAMLLSKGYLYYLAQSVPKNLLMWPVETLLLFAVFKALQPALIRMRWVENAQSGEKRR